MPDALDLAAWRRAAEQVSRAANVSIVQLASRWYGDPAWAAVRDDLDLAVFRWLLRGRPGRVRRLLLYDPPSDPASRPPDYEQAKAEHNRWVTRVRRQLAALGAPSSAGPGAVRGQDYRVGLVILPRAGRSPTLDLPDGIWLDSAPPAAFDRVWQAPGKIPLDPHEATIIGPYSDRSPLWVGSQT
ncbi:hypothetical protein [Phytohabitans houttuyneae]|uniref:Uncharacterized protein n=1 Tax=Phytohabitans houttuyneae TaxID=1076126 RepID=A0A6V8K0Y7_9ACTN|nr:hypothetical protein [Phytohabitans houttuyneae]GFJ75829.1 hypothetical protein Phou_000090 [Phytohabitans houttuyneae]